MPAWTKGGLRFASRRFLVHNMISSWSIPLSTGHSKPPQEPLRSCSCFVEAQMRIKKNVKVGKKNTKTSDQTHSDKPAFSLPAVPLQDKSFYSATSKGSVLRTPYKLSLPGLAELRLVSSCSLRALTSTTPPSLWGRPQPHLSRGLSLRQSQQAGHHNQTPVIGKAVCPRPRAFPQ